MFAIKSKNPLRLFVDRVGSPHPDELTLIIQLGNPTYMSLIWQQALLLNSLFNPSSELFCAPEATAGEGFTETYRRKTDLQVDISYDLYSSIVMPAIELLLAYVQQRNLDDSAYDEDESSEVDEMVYVALVHAHNWRIRSARLHAEQCEGQPPFETEWYSSLAWVSLVFDWLPSYRGESASLAVLPAVTRAWFEQYGGKG